MRNQQMATKTATKRYRNPNWWSKEYDSAWDRVKAAFRRDWEQTKHDFGGDAPDPRRSRGASARHRRRAS